VLVLGIARVLLCLVAADMGRGAGQNVFEDLASADLGRTAGFQRRGPLREVRALGKDAQGFAVRPGGARGVAAGLVQDAEAGQDLGSVQTCLGVLRRKAPGP
jgi:hypothetical protein